jgi:DNA-binding NtrC family response regulator
VPDLAHELAHLDYRTEKSAGPGAGQDADEGSRAMRNPEGATLIGTSPSIVALRAEIARIGRSNARVLITGESGVGKEVVARAIYPANPRCGGVFVPVNCAGIPESLLESELFGHVKGSFTGAYRDKPGKLDMPGGGTIFLDEIGEMTLRMQGLLLRFLETGELQRVGAERLAKTTNVRVLAATNRDLREQIRLGQFREDLFYRLNVIHLVVPPLRERREDIPLLIEHFLRNFTAQATDLHNGNGFGTQVESLSPRAMAALTEYDWPGNVRQLQNIIERIVVTARREVIEAEDLPLEVLPSAVADTRRPRAGQASSVADDLYRKLTEDQESFWTTVYPLYINREITKDNVRELVRKGLGAARGNYKIVLRMFNMHPGDYKRFLNFLRKHDCQLPFKEYRL